MVRHQNICKNFILYSCLLSLSIRASHIYITKVNCESYDDKYTTFPECRLRAVKRNSNEVTVRIKLHQPPVDNITALLVFMKKSNGYQPYIGQLKIDCCKFMKDMRNPVLFYLYGFIKPYTNVNHTCPFDHDIILNRLRVDQALDAIAPLPSGDYAFFATLFTNKIKRIHIRLYFKFEE